MRIVHEAIDAFDSIVSTPPPDAIQALVAERTAARARGDWSSADQLRDQIAAAGWSVRDTPDGPELIPV